MAQMKSKATLTSEDLVGLLDQELQRFSDEYFPLHTSQLDAIKRCTAVVDEDDNAATNVPKKRAQRILTDLWTHLPEAFLLCSLAATPSKLGSLKAVDYMKYILRWWDGVKAPAGLTKTFDRHLDVLPNASRDNLEVRLPIHLGELLAFLQHNFGQMLVEIVLPFSGSPSPYARLEGQVKIELSSPQANAFLQQRQHEV